AADGFFDAGGKERAIAGGGRDAVAEDRYAPGGYRLAVAHGPVGNERRHTSRRKGRDHDVAETAAGGIPAHVDHQNGTGGYPVDGAVERAGAADDAGTGGEVLPQ